MRWVDLAEKRYTTLTTRRTNVRLDKDEEVAASVFNFFSHVRLYRQIVDFFLAQLSESLFLCMSVEADCMPVAHCDAYTYIERMDGRKRINQQQL